MKILYQLVDLFVRDYVEIWYKTQISSDESFVHDLKNDIYTSIRHLVERFVFHGNCFRWLFSLITIRLSEIDWLDFCTGTIVDTFATHVRLYRKAKERMRLEQSTDIRSCFFDLEAEYERGICRDEVCLDKEKEKSMHFSLSFNQWDICSIVFLRDMVEVLIYILLPANEFRCVPARIIIRVCVLEILVAEIMNVCFPFQRKL